MDARVQLVFRGEVHPGHQLDEVKRRLGQAMKLDEARVGQLFSGARMVLKRSLQVHEAQRYVDHLARLGARIDVEPMAAPAPVPASTPLALALAPAEAPVEEQIVCPTCGEQQSKRILCRSCATNMPMGIAAKLEAEQEARAARQAAARARRPPTRGEIVDTVEIDPDAPSIWGFGLSGRLARLPYATASAWLLCLLALLTAYAIQRPSASRFVLLALGLLVVFLLSMRLAVLRCHDCERHGWWSLFLLVPYAGSLASLVLSLMPGTKGDNDYGGPPRSGRWLWLGIALVALVLSSGLALKNAMVLAERMAAQSSDDGDDMVEPDEAAALLPNAAAAAAFRNEYSLSASNKAFAASPGGSWGWRAGASSMQDAMRGAMSECDAHRKPYTPTCELVNVNGRWAPPSR